MPRGAPTEWALWDRYEFPRTKYAPRYIARVVHEACGPGWASVAACDVSPDAAWKSPYSTFDLLLSRAALLAPSRSDEERRQALWQTQRNNFSSQRKRLDPAERGIVVLLLFVGPAAYIAALWLLEDGPVGSRIAASVIAGIPVLVCLIWALVALGAEPERSTAG